MLHYYKLATTLLSPLVPLWLKFRACHGKEERGRIAERFGVSSYGRPKGTLLWIHAASVGEANSTLALIQQLKQRFPALSILLTTGTVTSAALMKQRLPTGVLHHYAPVDTPEATERFIRHWLPDVVWFVESELWPNLIDAAKRYFCMMALINARMSERSFYFWQKYPAAAREILSPFYINFAQSESDADRLRILGAKEVLTFGNLKYDAPLLPCNEAELLTLKNTLAGRPLWLAASTHPQEEILVAKTHQQLMKAHPKLLTVIVPRHAERGAEIAKALAPYGRVALRSQRTPITPDTAFYIADTMGELGLFYRLCEVTFIGGSLVEHGGQNPLEAAQLSCAIVVGSHTHNFQDIYASLHQHKAAILVNTVKQLTEQLHQLLANTTLRMGMQDRAKMIAQEQVGVSTRIIDLFAPLFES